MKTGRVTSQFDALKRVSCSSRIIKKFIEAPRGFSIVQSASVVFSRVYKECTKGSGVVGFDGS